MAFKSRESLLSHLEDKKTTWYEVYDKTGKNLLDKSDKVQGGETLDVGICASMLKEFLDSQGDDWFLIYYKSGNASGTKPFANTFRNKDTEGLNYESKEQTISGPTYPTISPEDLQRQITEGIEKGILEYNEKLRIKNLEEENKELKKQIKDLDQPSQLDEMIGKVGPYIIPMIQKMAGGATISGPHKNSETMDKNRIEINPEDSGEQNAGEKLAEQTAQLYQKIDDAGMDVTDVLEKLNRIDPEKLKSILGMLNMM
jgi:hypothetical protein